MVYVRSTNKANPNDSSARIWFAGEVTVGTTFVIDATNAGQTKLEIETFVYIYASLAGYSQGEAPLQSIRFHTSCSQPLQLGDRFGNIQLFAYRDEGGSSTEGASVGNRVWNDTNGNGNQDSGEPGIPGVTVTLQGIGDTVTDANGDYLFEALDAGTYTVSVDPDEAVFDPYLTPSTGTSFETTLGEGQGYFAADFGFSSTVCRGAKPQALTLSYDGSLGPYVRVTDKSNPFDQGGKVFFAGEVNGQFTAYSELAGSHEFPANIYIHVYDADGNLVESITVKTDCSQPLFLGQTFGSGDNFELVDFVPKGQTVTVPPLAGPIVQAVPTISGKNVDFRLLNFGADQVMDTIDIIWPVDPNKQLLKVKLDGTTLWDKKAKVSPTTISSPDWKGNAGNRTVTAGDIGLLRFEFEKNVALAGSGLYSVTIHFVGGGSTTVDF
jgi:hypothetical protein